LASRSISRWVPTIVRRGPIATVISAKELLQYYDKFTVGYLRRLDAALTNLGAAKVPVIPSE
ncbi:hypothetical protein Q8Q64_08070, partial [Pseudomonas sp. Qb2C2]